MRLRTLAEQFVRWRVSAFLLGAGAVFVALAARQDTLALIFTLVWLVGFTALARRNGHVKQTIAMFEQARLIKRTHIARMGLKWPDLPPALAVDPMPDHPFALDLDLIGPRSMHHLLDTAATRGGSLRLAMWLLDNDPDPQVIQYRQGLVRALIPLRAFRDRLALNAALVAGPAAGRWSGARLTTWLEHHPPRVTDRILWLLTLLAGINVVLFAASSVLGLPPVWLVTLFIYGFISAFQWRNLAGLFDEALSLSEELTRLRAVLHTLECYEQRDSGLRALCAPFLDRTRQPSAMLRKVGVIASAASLQRNPVIWLIVNFIVPWDVFFAHRLERSKDALGAIVPQWLDALYEIEALSALAAFADLNPDYVFPRVGLDGDLLHAVGIGHPLIAASQKIVNDFSLSAPGQVIILTGSNMSGKSSFLRTLGVNLCLAYAGGVVNAASVDIRLMRLFACIRVSDSLADGFSYFYAEVRRLKALLQALNTDDSRPLFYVIDEIFRGTNNRERLIGSRAYVRSLMGGHGAGLIATHDLELATLEHESGKVRNYHFREDVAEGRIIFDYALRPGPSPTTNALRIMALEGLPVDSPEG